MAGLVLESHHLVFYGRAVSGTLALYPPPVLWGLMQVGLYHGVRGCCGVSQVACQLWPLNMYLHKKDARWAESIAIVDNQGYPQKKKVAMMVPQSVRCADVTKHQDTAESCKGVLRKSRRLWLQRWMCLR